LLQKNGASSAVFHSALRSGADRPTLVKIVPLATLANFDYINA
jgi:hypothetical protein